MMWLPEELEGVRCDFCGSEEASEKIVRLDGMQVIECAVCGLAYLNPRPKREVIHELYQEDYFNGVKSRRGEGGLMLDSGERTAAVRKLEIVSKKIGGIDGKFVLEIGCATGDLLSVMKSMGAKVAGLEISSYAAKIARERSLPVMTGTIDSIADRWSFDVIVAFELIEHVTSPSKFLNDVAGLLRDGGYLAISTPNYACAHRFGKDWFGFRASYEHLFFFTIDVLKRMAVRSGLTLKYWETSSFSGESKYRPAKRFFKRGEIYLPYGHGHNVVMLFMKDQQHHERTL